MTDKPKLTFSLRSLLAAFAVIASALGAFGAGGVIVGLLLVFGIAFVRTAPQSQSKWPLAAIIVVIFACFLLPAMQSARESSRRGQCQNNLKQIALALHNYREQYGTFPPAFIPGPDGRPWHSWRVLLLPFLEEGARYAKYNFNEPWDAPNNRKLAAEMPAAYLCPSIAGYGYCACRATYLAVVGDKTAWPGAQSRSIDDIPDGADQTILVLEVPASDVCWMEPQDIDFDAIAAAPAPDLAIIGSGGHLSPSTYFFIGEGKFVHAAMADGSVHAIACDAVGKPLVPLLTADGGEEIDVESFSPMSRTRLNWPRVLSLVALAASSLLFWWTTPPRAPVVESQSSDPLP